LIFKKQNYINTVTADYRSWTGAIEDQMQAGSCTGFAVTNIVELYVDRLTGAKVDLSALENYYSSRSLFGGQNNDGGSFVKFALQAGEKGFLNESQWSSTDMQHINVAPDKSLYDHAPNIKITSWEMLDFNPDSASERMWMTKFALQAGYTPILEADVDVKFMHETRQIADQIWNNPSLSTTGQYAEYGRHAVAAEAWISGHTVIENQWKFADGKLWGDHGFGILDPMSSTDSAYIITGMEINGKKYDMHYTDSRVWVNKFYVSLFNRAAEVSGMDYWAHLIDSGASLSGVVKAMANCDQAEAIYPSTAEASELVKTFYHNVLGREPDAAGLQHWVNDLQNKSFGECVVDIINATMDYSGTDAGGLSSQSLFMNKLAVSTYNSIICADNNMQIAENLLDNVTADVNSVNVAEAHLQQQLYDFGWG